MDDDLTSNKYRQADRMEMNPDTPRYRVSLSSNVGLEESIQAVRSLPC